MVISRRARGAFGICKQVRRFMCGGERFLCRAFGAALLIRDAIKSEIRNQARKEKFHVALLTGAPCCPPGRSGDGSRHEWRRRLLNCTQEKDPLASQDHDAGPAIHM